MDLLGADAYLALPVYTAIAFPVALLVATYAHRLYKARLLHSMLSNVDVSVGEPSSPARARRQNGVLLLDVVDPGKPSGKHATAVRKHRSQLIFIYTLGGLAQAFIMGVLTLLTNQGKFSFEALLCVFLALAIPTTVVAAARRVLPFRLRR